MKGYMWLPGHHPAAMTPRGVVVMAPGNLHLTCQCWKILHEGGDLVVIMGKLVEHVGDDLTSLPEFVAVVVKNQQLHVAIRGEYELIVRGAGGTEIISGGTATWWTERRFVDVEWWRIVATTSGKRFGAEVWGAVDGCVPVAIVESVNDRVEYEPQCGKRFVEPRVQVETLGDSYQVAPERNSLRDGVNAVEKAESMNNRPASVPAADWEEDGVVNQTEMVRDRTLGETSYFAGIGDAAEWNGLSRIDASMNSHGNKTDDHDEQSIYSTRISELQAKAPELAKKPEYVGIPGTTPKVLALLCINGHPNPTHVQNCRECSSVMSETSVLITQPKLGTLVLSNGTREELYKDIVIGRAPRINEAMAGRQRAVTVPSPKKEISRNHCEIRVTGWDVRLRDLGSNNGTLLVRPGQNPVLVSETAPVMMQPGDIIDLGDGLTIWLEG